MFDFIVRTLRPHFDRIQRQEYFDNIVAGDSSYRVAMAPPSAVISLAREQRLSQHMRDCGLYKDDSTRYPLLHLADHLHSCSFFISSSTVEITPAFLPSRRIDYLTDNHVRRVYLSATLTSEVDFCRAFGKRPTLRIEPESDAGVGERLFILMDNSKLNNGRSSQENSVATLKEISINSKVLVTAASYVAADKYKSYGTVPTSSEFSAALDAFRLRSSGVFVLVGRVDGIDLPHATCRVMLIDGLPAGFSLYESYLFDFLEMRNSFAAKLANRITQMFGRTNRGRNDYSVIFSLNEQLVSWITTPRNAALLPELLRKQLLLGRSLVEQFRIGSIEVFPQLVRQVLDRDQGWLEYYKSSIVAGDIDDDQRQQASDNDEQLVEGALAEAEFGAHIWDGSAGLARKPLHEVVDKIVTADRRLAGWYNIQIGMTLEMELDAESAAKQYAEARSRTNALLPLPVPETTQSIIDKQSVRNRLHLNLLNIFENDVRDQNDRIAKYEHKIKMLFDVSRSASEHEEALRLFGELMGFEATRPEQESDTNSTLDVLWIDEVQNSALLIEMKSKKKNSSMTTVADLGQCANHIEWFRVNNPSVVSLGLVILSDNKEVSPQCAPLDQIFVSNVGAFKKIYDDFFSMIRSLHKMTPLGRYAEISAICSRVEWTLPFLFQALEKNSIADLKK